MGDGNTLSEEYKAKLEEWKKKFKDEWDYKRKFVVFEDGKGNLITPPKPVSTTAIPDINVTDHITNVIPTTTFSPVVVINSTTATPREAELSTADTTQLIKIVGITCGALVGLILLIVIFIRVCRRPASKRRNQRISLRRPLNSEPEEHIYAEIEPIQLTRTDSPSGASGSDSTSVKLPSRKDKRRSRGAPSFRAISTRIYRFFNQDHDDHHSVKYHASERTERLPLGTLEAPEPPNRNTLNGRANKRGRDGKGLSRFKSTASQRPLLDGDSVGSTTSADTAEMRSNIYNPLIRQNEARASGPYADLTMKRESGDGTPPSPHDYFTLEATRNKGAEGASGAPTEYFTLENEKKHDISTILEDEAEEEEPPKGHDYFILEPQAKPSSEAPSKSPEKSSAEVGDISNKSPIKAANSEATVTDTNEKQDETSSISSNGSKIKPQAKPRFSKSASSDTSRSNPTSPTTENVSSENGELIKTDEDEVYMLSKLGDAPQAPIPETEDNYLQPLDKKRATDYIDVLPNPPPRTTSKNPPVVKEVGKKMSVESDV